MNRRDVMIGAGAAAAAGFAGNLAAAQPAGRLNLGIQAFTFNRMMSTGDWEQYSRAMELSRQIGYDSIELAGLSGHKPDKVRKRAEELGLALHSCHIGNDLARVFQAPGDQGVAAAQDAVYTPQAIIQVVKIGVPLARDLGCQWAGIGAIGRSSFVSLDALKRICDSMNACADIAQAAGLKFFYHNHAQDFRPLEGRIPFEFIIEHTQPNLRMEIDSGWAMTEGYDVVPMIDKFASRIDLVHLRDANAKHETTIPGDGLVDFNKIKAACAKLNKPIYYMEGNGRPEPECIAEATRAYRYLHGLGWGRA
jgi:sugar phosphate isomerase/epimerase